MKRKPFVWGIIISLTFCNVTISIAQDNILRQIIEVEIKSFLEKGRLDAAINSLNNLCSLNYIKNNWDLYCFNRLEIAKAYSKIGNFPISKQIALSTLKIAEEHFVPDSQDFIELYYRLGSLYIDLGEIKQAKEYLDKSLVSISKLNHPDTILFAQISYKLGSYYFFNDELDSSFAKYMQAYNSVKNIDSLKDLKSNCYQSIGIILTLKGDFAKAERYLKLAYEINYELYSNNFEKLANINLNLGRFYQNIGLYKESLEYLNNAENLINKMINQNPNVLFRIYWNKGISYNYLGESPKSIVYLEKAMHLSNTLFQDINNIQYPLIMDLAYCYDNSGNKEKAEEYYKLCLNSTNNSFLVRLYKNLGTLYVTQNKYIEANDYFNKAIKISLNELRNDSSNLAHTYMKYGEYLFAQENLMSLYYLEKALDIYKKIYGLKNKDVAIIKSLLGQFHFQKKNGIESLNYFHDAMMSFFPNDTLIDFKDYPNVDHLLLDPFLLEIISNIIKSLMQLNDSTPNFAYSYSIISGYDTYSKYIHKLLSFYNNQETRLELTRKHENIYGQAIHACRMAFYETRDSSFLHKAFDFSERNKSMNLLMAIKDEDAKELGNIPDSLKVRERELKLTRNIYNKSLHEEKSKEKPDQNKINYLNDKLLPLESEYNSLLHLLEKDYPDYFTLKYDFSTTSAKRIQSILGDHEMLLEYTLGEDSIYIFGITSKRFDLLAKKIDSNMIKDIFTLRSNLKLWDIQNYGEGNFIEYQACATRLFDLLFRPFDTVPGIESIIIIPDDEIGYLSFDILLSEQTKNGKVDFRGLPFLIKKYRISYAPSASIYAYNLGKNQMTSQKGLLAFAPVYNSQLEDYFNAGMDISSNRRNLPGAIDEVKNIPRKYFGKKFLANMATENNFKKNAGLYDILHLAMHTRISDDYPMTSVLKFYPSGHNKEDDLLHTYEIFNLKLSSRMVVLSACSSGNGKLEKGEGINSLARAFLYAGAKSIIMTLWDVEDGASRKLVTDFYDFLANGLSKDEALRQAKLKYLEEVSYLKEGHPYFWSGYVVYGDTEPIIYPMISFGRIKSDLPWLILSVLFVFSSLVLFTRYLDRRRKTQQWRHSYTRKILKKRSAFPR